MIILTTFFCNTITGSNSCLDLHCCITLASEVRYVFQVHDQHLPRSSRSGHAGDVSETNGRFCLVPVGRFPGPFRPIYFGDIWGEYTFCTSPIIHLICPPKFCISIGFNFRWNDCNTQEKWKTKVMQNFGGQIRFIMGNKWCMGTQACCIAFWKCASFWCPSRFCKQQEIMVLKPLWIYSKK